MLSRNTQWLEGERSSKVGSHTEQTSDGQNLEPCFNQTRDTACKIVRAPHPLQLKTVSTSAVGNADQDAQRAEDKCSWKSRQMTRSRSQRHGGSQQPDWTTGRWADQICHMRWECVPRLLLPRSVNDNDCNVIGCVGNVQHPNYVCLAERPPWRSAVQSDSEWTADKNTRKSVSWT